MGKGLFLSWPAIGHLNPVLSLLKGLQENGHEIHCFGGRGFRDMITQTGVQFKEYPIEINDLSGHNSPDLFQMSSVLASENLKILEALLPIWRAEEYDFVIHDSLFLCGAVFAKQLGLPSVTSHTMFAINKALISREMNVVEALKGLKSIPSLFQYLLLKRTFNRKYNYKISLAELMCPSSDRVLVFTSELFQKHAGLFDKSQYHFIGPNVADRKVVKGDSFAALDKAVKEEKKVVFMSLGTLFNKNGSFFKDVLSLFEGRDEYFLFMSIGKNVSPEELGPVPKDVYVAPFLPQVEILAKAHLFITHSGMNGISEAILHSVPMICCPQQREQEMNAQRVEELGAGVYLSKRKQNSVELERAFKDVELNYLHMKKAVMSIRLSFKRAKGIPGALQVIEELVQTPQEVN